ncbi:MBL fold metallo-hydrolase [Bacillus sp. 1P06AnD]|uniref:MBL fold metallo-hydrolase n=1 Tax=Bacillus sp. 1P06AnD TaxID=3132208 RepID=UPI0039A29B97
MFSFIGIGSAFNTALGNNNACMKKEKDLFLIDCGSTNFSRIMERGMLDGVRQITLLQTHLHADHVGSLGDLVGYSFNVMKPQKVKKISILSPKALVKDIQEILRSEGISDDQYDQVAIGDSYAPKDLMGITSIKPYLVEHVPTLTCFAYLMEIDGKNVYYSGDCNMVPDDILSLMLDGKIDQFYQDTSKADPENNVHLSLRKLTELIPAEHRDKVYCMHLDETFSREEAESLGFHVVESV